MARLRHTQILDWKGRELKTELYEADDITGLSPLRQAQAVSFTDPDHVVLFWHADGYYSLAGGALEEGEGPADALHREVMEESSCRVLSAQVIGYIKVTDTSSGDIFYQARYFAEVESLDEPVHDPDGKAVRREIVPFDKAADILGWGDRARILLDLARKKYTSFIRK